MRYDDDVMKQQHMNYNKSPFIFEVEIRQLLA